MQAQTQEDAQEIASVVSGLSSLENGADDFERLMIQNERDQRRLNEARHGRPHAFRKARTHPRVGLTIDNLEKNNARNDAALAANARVQFGSPPSSSGSARSDPAIHAPASWGRKGRSNRNWMRGITYEEEVLQQHQRTPVAADDTRNGHYDPFHEHAYDANVPRRSVEDSPLSHKSSVRGTPQHDRSQDWDLTFELNEASMIASTPYIPRSTRLDDIRQIEVENLEEQAASPVQPHRKLHTRTKSWQSIGKSQPVTGTGNEISPVALYKSAENIAPVDNGVTSTMQPSPPVRAPYRREDSQDLLRKLARVSNTPSPAQRTAPRPNTALACPPTSSSQTVAGETTTLATKKEDMPIEEAPVAESNDVAKNKEPDVPSKAALLNTQNSHEDLAKRFSNLRPKAGVEPEPEDVDVTPAPVDRAVLHLKTPVVTGAWIDTPKTRTGRKVDVRPRSPSKSTRKHSSSHGDNPTEPEPPTPKAVQRNEPEPEPEPEPKPKPIEPIRPSLPTSALQALVEGAKKGKRRSSDDYGDSTINSLEELITPLPESVDGEAEEDTLQGIQLPTSPPKNEAERRRQQEAQQLHSMNAKLRAARTSIRHASRGMQRVEERVDHVEFDKDGSRVKTTTIISQQEVTLWSLMRGVFWHEPTKIHRQQRKSRLRHFGGLTPFAIFLLCFVIWGLSEVWACDNYCRKEYARFSPHPWAIQPDPPEPPFVIESLIYKTLIRPWWPSAWSSALWSIWWLITWIPTYIATTAFHLLNARSTSALHTTPYGMGWSTTTAQNYRASSTFVAQDADYGSMLDDQII